MEDSINRMKKSVATYPQLLTRKILCKQGRLVGTMEITAEEEKQMIQEEYSRKIETRKQEQKEINKLRRPPLNWNNGVTQRDTFFAREMYPSEPRDPDFTRPPKTFTVEEQEEIDKFLKEFTQNTTQEEYDLREELRNADPIGVCKNRTREEVTHLSEDVD